MIKLLRNHRAPLAALLLALLFALGGCGSAAPQNGAQTPAQSAQPSPGAQSAQDALPAPDAPDALPADGTLALPAEPPQDGVYTSKDEVALYLSTYGCLPQNFITKKQAQKLGWNSREGNLDEIAPGMSIGGDRFGNRAGTLPSAKGRKYFECDIDFDGGYRGAKRIIYSNDGLVYYTDDHYETFTLLYGDDGA